MGVRKGRVQCVLMCVCVIEREDRGEREWEGEREEKSV